MCLGVCICIYTHVLVYTLSFVCSCAHVCLGGCAHMGLDVCMHISAHAGVWGVRSKVGTGGHGCWALSHTSHTCTRRPTPGVSPSPLAQLMPLSLPGCDCHLPPSAPHSVQIPPNSLANPAPQTLSLRPADLAFGQSPRAVTGPIALAWVCSPWGHKSPRMKLSLAAETRLACHLQGTESCSACWTGTHRFPSAKCHGQRAGSSWRLPSPSDRALQGLAHPGGPQTFNVTWINPASLAWAGRAVGRRNPVMTQPHQQGWGLAAPLTTL